MITSSIMHRDENTFINPKTIHPVSISVFSMITEFILQFLSASLFNLCRFPLNLPIVVWTNEK